MLTFEFSQELVAFMRTVMEIIPVIVFGILRGVIALQVRCAFSPSLFPRVHFLSRHKVPLPRGMLRDLGPRVKLAAVYTLQTKGMKPMPVRMELGHLRELAQVWKGINTQLALLLYLIAFSLL
jgi:hypothetical protein